MEAQAKGDDRRFVSVLFGCAEHPKGGPRHGPRAAFAAKHFGEKVYAPPGQWPPSAYPHTRAGDALSYGWCVEGEVDEGGRSKVRWSKN